MVALLFVGVWLVGCGPNKQILKMKRQIARLQQEKFEAMQVRRVALERRQKRCQVELENMRDQHRKLSFKVSKMTNKIQGLLNQIVSDTLLMPHRKSETTSRKDDYIEPAPAPVSQGKPLKKAADDQKTKPQAKPGS